MNRQASGHPGEIGPGFLVATGVILAAGLSVYGLAWWLGVHPGIQSALLRGVLTAAAGCATWMILIRTSRDAATRAFLTALVGGMIIRMILYGAILAVSALQGTVHLTALILALLGSHLAYQSAEILAVYRSPRRRGSVTVGALLLVAALVLAGLPARAEASGPAAPGGDTSVASDVARAGGDGEAAPGVDPGLAGEQHQAQSRVEDDEQPEGEQHGEGEKHEFDIVHHIADGSELDTPIGIVHLPTDWTVGGIDLAPTKHVVWMWIASFFLVVFVFIARRSTGLVSHGLGNALESLVVFIRDEVARKNIPHSPDKFTPYLCSLFFFILACNLTGLLPFGATATGNLNLTGALAFLSLLLIQGSGIRQNGLVGHVKAFCPIPSGVPGWLLPMYIPIIVVVEIVGIFAKPLALALRLFANMTAGHVVILSLIGIIFILQTVLVSPAIIAFALFIYCLEVFIGFVQAYIFAMLTALFIGFSQHPMH